MALLGFNFTLIDDTKLVSTRCSTWTFLPRQGDVIAFGDRALEVTSVVINTANDGGEVALHSYDVHAKAVVAPASKNATAELEFDDFMNATK